MDYNQKLIDITTYPIVALLDKLLEDRTTKKNIIWATDAYELYGYGFQDKNQILSSAFIMGKALTIRPRIEKALDEQQSRTRKKAEVFTPAWLCNQMNNYLDEDFFDDISPFNTINNDNTWAYNKEKIIFKDNDWKKYIRTRCLEITCGEAPFLVSRYDTSTGLLIHPPFDRIGILDRKLRVISENVDDEKEWMDYVTKAYQNTYGYEYQGDNLLIARINLLLSFIDYYKGKFNKEPELKQLQNITNIITWNVWQMDGLKDTVPLGKPFVQYEQIDLFGDFEKEKAPATPCVIKDWRTNKTIQFRLCKRNNMTKKLFDYVIGNPPYQEETSDNNRQTPVYDKFISESIKISNCVEVITPARFLFNAGQTPKKWNEQMLNDIHFKVLKYENNASKIFPNTDIKGGVAITIRNNKKNYGKIGVFTSNPTLNKIVNRVQPYINETDLSLLAHPKSQFGFTEQLYIEHPCFKNRLTKGNEYIIDASIFDKIPELFLDKQKNTNDIYIYTEGKITKEKVIIFLENISN